jgi:hypothetical protein
MRTWYVRPTVDRSRTVSAWANIDAQASAVLAKAYNVSNLTDNGDGDFTLTFTAAFGNANYAVGVSAATGGFVQGHTNNTATAKAASAVRVSTWNASNALTNYNPTCVICVGH